MPLESNQVEEDLEVNLFRILYPVPVRVNNTFGGSSVGSGSDDFYQVFGLASFNTSFEIAIDTRLLYYSHNNS